MIHFCLNHQLVKTLPRKYGPSQIKLWIKYFTFAIHNISWLAPQGKVIHKLSQDKLNCLKSLYYFILVLLTNKINVLDSGNLHFEMWGLKIVFKVVWRSFSWKEICFFGVTIIKQTLDLSSYTFVLGKNWILQNKMTKFECSQSKHNNVCQWKNDSCWKSLGGNNHLIGELSSSWGFKQDRIGCLIHLPLCKPSYRSYKLCYLFVLLLPCFGASMDMTEDGEK